MNSAPTVQLTGAASLNADTESGNTNPATLFGSPSPRSALSTSAGSDATLELELNAINCDGSAARANLAIGIPANTLTTGYSISVTTRHMAMYATMSNPIAPASDAPACAASGSTSATIPIGAGGTT